LNEANWADKKWRKGADFHCWNHLKFILDLEFPDSDIKSENTVFDPSTDVVPT